MEHLIVFGLGLVIFFGAKLYIEWKAKKAVERYIYWVRPKKTK